MIRIVSKELTLVHQHHKERQYDFKCYVLAWTTYPCIPNVGLDEALDQISVNEDLTVQVIAL